MYNKGQITIGLKIALGIITAGGLSFGGWLANNWAKIDESNRQQDKAIIQLQTIMPEINRRLEKIETNIDDVLEIKVESKTYNKPYQDQNWINEPAR